jgi:hypothetical protein
VIRRKNSNFLGNIISKPEEEKWGMKLKHILREREREREGGREREREGGRERERERGRERECVLNCKLIIHIRVLNSFGA